MPPIRIVLATLSPMLADIVRQLLSGHVDIAVIAEVASVAEMRDVLRHARCRGRHRGRDVGRRPCLPPSTSSASIPGSV